jgi:hypothetical protein
MVPTLIIFSHVNSTKNVVSWNRGGRGLRGAIDLLRPVDCFPVKLKPNLVLMIDPPTEDPRERDEEHRMHLLYALASIVSFFSSSPI